MSVRILALVGSLRAGSYNRQLAETAAKLAPEGATVDIYEDLGELPFYNEDIDTEAGAPASAVRLREAADAADALLLITPEYNGTMPAALKNAIDWLSRPFGAGAIRGKSVAVIGTALGQYGGVWAHDDVRRSAGVAGGTVVEDVKLSIPGSANRFAETHPAADAEVSEQLGEVLGTLVEHAGRK